MNTGQIHELLTVLFFNLGRAGKDSLGMYAGLQGVRVMRPIAPLATVIRELRDEAWGLIHVAAGAMRVEDDRVPFLNARAVDEDGILLDAPLKTRDPLDGRPLEVVG